jgi:chromosomal replication initiation ATPase DnaA
MFTEFEKLDHIYRGMNPDFVRKVWERRRAEEHEQRLAEQKRKHREREQARIREREAVKDMRAEMKAKIEAEREAERLANQMAKRAAEAGLSVDDVAQKTEQSAREIIEAVAIMADMTYADLVGYSRVKRVVAVRHRAIIEVYTRKPSLSLVQIGRVFKRDHSTIIHALAKAGVKRSAAT